MTHSDPGRPAEPSDADLLARHVAGDPEAFGQLVRRHRDRLWAVAVRTLGDRDEAADAVQDALLSAYRSAAGFQGRSAVTTWLHRIVVNACLDRVRRAEVRHTTGFPEGRPTDEQIPPAEGADTAAERDEFRRAIEKALRGLPFEQRAVLVLVDMEGYAVQEAAEILGVPVGTVKSRCARGRARLLPVVRNLRQQREEGAGNPTRRRAVSPPGQVRGVRHDPCTPDGGTLTDDLPEGGDHG